VIQDGHQVGIGYTNTNSAYGISVDRPSFAAGCTAKNLPTKGSDQYRALNGWVNTACLTTPAAVPNGTALGFGNTPNGVLRTPDQDVADISLAKSFGVHWPRESAKVAFRSDFFNAFNHPTFGTPNLSYTPTGSAFGYITAMSTNPRVVQFSLNYSF
jgi:hypothetical protein